MDSARLGRALGAGTRQLAKTAVEVGRAINTPGPQEPGPNGAETQGRAPEATPRVTQPPGAPTSARRSRAVPAAAAMRRSRASFLNPLKRFTGTVWLQVTGTFFLLFAMSLGTAAWKIRGARLDHGSAGQHHFWLYLAFAALFAYFAVSSFVRAEKR